MIAGCNDPGRTGAVARFARHGPLVTSVMCDADSAIMEFEQGGPRNLDQASSWAVKIHYQEYGLNALLYP